MVTRGPRSRPCNPVCSAPSKSPMTALSQQALEGRGNGEERVMLGRLVRSWIIAIATAGLLAACGDDNDSPQRTPTPTQAAPTVTPTPAEPPCTQCEENCGTGSSCGCFGTS